MKNKKTIIILSIMTIVIVAIILGVLYFTTDLFKSNQQLFYKYISQTKAIDSNFLKQCKVANNKISKNSNSSLAEVNISTQLINQETGMTENKNIWNIRSNGLSNVLLKQSYRDFVFSSEGQNFLTLKYIKDNNTYGIIADNILAKYLAVENSNLKELFLKLGVTDTSVVPNQIPTNYEEILKIDENTLKTLEQNYFTLIYKNIDDTHFYKIKNSDKTITLGISLSEQEFMNILKLVLENAKNDNILLNLLTNKAVLLGYSDITVKNIQDQIQSYIDDISDNTYSSDIDCIKLSLLKKDKRIIAVGLEVNYNEKVLANTVILDTREQTEARKTKYSTNIDFVNTNEINIILKENDIDVAKAKINYSYDDNSIEIKVATELNKNEEDTNKVELQYQISNYQTDNIEQKITSYITRTQEEKYQINLQNNITLKQDIQISKLTTDNSAKINNMSSEELRQLFIALMNRITTLYGKESLNLIN